MHRALKLDASASAQAAVPAAAESDNKASGHLVGHVEMGGLLHADALHANKELLDAACTAYYSGADSGISDADFDARKAYHANALETLWHAAHPAAAALALASPVGAPVARDGPLCKVRHDAAHGGRLLSLDAMHSASEVRQRWWQATVEPAVLAHGLDPSTVELVVEPKIDGLTLRATYRDGVCVQVRCACACVSRRPPAVPWRRWRQQRARWAVPRDVGSRRSALARRRLQGATARSAKT
jgi:NAD-dependent DNA ligase adenylation domain